MEPRITARQYAQLSDQEKKSYRLELSDGVLNGQIHLPEEAKIAINKCVKIIINDLPGKIDAYKHGSLAQVLKDPLFDLTGIVDLECRGQINAGQRKELIDVFLGEIENKWISVRQLIIKEFEETRPNESNWQNFIEANWVNIRTQLIQHLEERLQQNDR